MPTSPLKIGIIDSGINLQFLQTAKMHVVGGASFKIDWQGKKLNSAFYSEADILAWRNNLIDLDIADQSGHGTAVASILHGHIDIPVEFYIAKILDGQTSGSALCLIEAMNWLIDNVQAQYINLSLGTNNWQMHSRMFELVKRAQLQNCHLFSAAGDIPTLPSELGGVIAIGTRALALNNTENVKLDCVALPSHLIIFHNQEWIEAEITTSYACPLILAEHCKNI